METASLLSKEPGSLATSVVNNESNKVNCDDAKGNVPASTMFTGKTKVKKKMRVEDIITNLTNKIKQVSSTSVKEGNVKKDESTPVKENERKDVGVASTMAKTNVLAKQIDFPSNGEEPKDEDASSFASMCNIRDNPPVYADSELPPFMNQNTEQSSVMQEKKKSAGNVVQSPRIIGTTPAVSNSPNPVRQVILQTVPQKNMQQTPIILNKLPPGFIIKSDRASSSFPNLQATTTSAPPKLLLITKSGGPFFLAQNVTASTNQTQAKPANKHSASPVLTQTKSNNDSKNSTEVMKGKAINSNKNVLRITSPSKTTTEAPLITVQYNLPYPNNNCKVVSNPTTLRTTQTSQPGTFTAISNLPVANKVLITELPRPSRPREMVVNFAGNQTAHITTMTDETSVVSEKRNRFVPSFICGSPPGTPTIKKTKPSAVAEKRNDKTVLIVSSPSTTTTNTREKIDAVNRKVSLQTTQRRSIYDEKIAKLNGKNTDTGQVISTLNGKTKTLSNGIQKKSDVAVNNVRVSNRKRQQTEKAKLFEKETKKRKRDVDKSPDKEKKGKEKLDIKVKLEKPNDCNVVLPKKINVIQIENPRQTLSKSPSKKSKTVQQQTLTKDSTPSKENEKGKENTKQKEKEDDPDSLFRDPALLTREQRALQRALMRFKELEEKQARKESVSDTEKTSSRKSARTNQLNKTSDTQHKRKVLNEAKQEDYEEIVLKKRKRDLKRQSIEKNEIQNRDTDQKQKDTQVTVKTVQQESNLPDDDVNLVLHSDENGKRKEIRKKVLPPKKTEVKSDAVKDSPGSTKENKIVNTVKDIPHTSKVLKPPLKTPDAVNEKHRVKTYMLVPSYHGFKDFSPVVLGSRTRSKKIEPVKTEKEEEVPVTSPPEKTEKDIPLLVIETVGNKPVKQDVVAKDEQMRDFVKNSLRQQGMLKQELELEKDEDAEQFENREKRNLTVNRNTGETVLHKASRMGYDETVYHCIQQGSDSNAKDNAGWTPLHEACSRGHSDVVRVLVKYNADVNACSNDGIRPIHDAADNGKIDSLRLLMAYGADPFINTYSGRSVIDCAKRTEAKDYVKACIGDLYLNDERNNIVSVDHENRWDFRGSSFILDKDRKYLGDIFDNAPKQPSSNSLEFEWSETPHLPSYSLPLMKDGIVVGRKNYILFKDLQETLNKPRQNVIRLLKRTKVREISWMEFSKEVCTSSFNKLNEWPSDLEEGSIELVPLNWTVRSLLKIKCEHLAL